jgi:hypothetical protein
LLTATVSSRSSLLRTFIGSRQSRWISADTVADDDRGADQAARPARGRLRQAVPACVVLGEDGDFGRQDLADDRVGEFVVARALLRAGDGEQPRRAALRNSEHRARVGQRRFQQTVQHDLVQLLRRAGRPHLQGEAIQQREVAADPVAVGRGERLVADRLVGRGEVVAGLAHPLLDRHAGAGGSRGAGRQGGQLVEALNEQEPAAAQADLIARPQVALALERLLVDPGAVEAAAVADAPLAGGEVDLGVLAAAQVVVENHLVGLGPAEGVALPRVQGEHAAQPIGPADHEKGLAPRRHGASLGPQGRPARPRGAGDGGRSGRP